MRFEGKVVWVTGASSGLGEALAHAFHRDGAHVVLSARREDELDRVAGAMTGGAGDRMVLPLDLADPASLERAAAAALARFGRIDILVNNAGRTLRALAIDTEMAVFRDLIEVNYLGPLALAKLVLPSMVEHGGGRIVVISSVAAKYATPFRSGYTASKAALERIFDAIRAEAWAGGIAVTTIVLGGARTNISVNAATADGSDYGRMNRIQAAGMDPDEAARRVLRAVADDRNEVMIAPLWQRWEVWRAQLLPGHGRRKVRLRPRA